jgi:quinol monooxygenase YgiN
MTSMTPMTAASLMADVPGCELWLVQRDLDDADMIRVTEMWARRQHGDAALNLPGVDKNAAQVTGLLDRPPEVADGEPLGGARMLRGSTGATAFSILDAPWWTT